MTSPSLRRLRKLISHLPLPEQRVIAGYCLIYDGSADACDAFRRVALAGIHALIGEMRGENDHLKTKPKINLAPPAPGDTSDSAK